MTPDRAFAGRIVAVGVRYGFFGRPVMTIERAAVWTTFAGDGPGWREQGTLGMRDARARDLPEVEAFLAKQEGRWKV